MAAWPAPGRSWPVRDSQTAPRPRGRISSLTQPVSLETAPANCTTQLYTAVAGVMVATGPGNSFRLAAAILGSIPVVSPIFAGRLKSPRYHAIAHDGRRRLSPAGLDHAHPCHLTDGPEVLERTGRLQAGTEELLAQGDGRHAAQMPWRATLLTTSSLILAGTGDGPANAPPAAPDGTVAAGACHHPSPATAGGTVGLFPAHLRARKQCKSGGYRSHTSYMCFLY